MNYHQGLRYQRGRGLGAIFSGIFRSLKPLASMGLKYGKKFIQSDLGKNLKDTILDSGATMLRNTAADIIEGKNLKESTSESIEDIKSKIASTLRGKGRARKRKSKINYKNSKKSYYLLD